MSTESLFKYGILNNVQLTPRQYEELIRRMGPKKAEKYINQLSVYIPNRTKKPYKSHFAVLLKWWLADVKDDESIEAAADDYTPKGAHHVPVSVEKESWQQRIARRNREAAAEFDQQLSAPTRNDPSAGDPDRESARVLPSPRRIK